MRLKVTGKEPSEYDQSWIRYGHELLIGSPRALEDAAKSLITLESSLLTIYIAALSFLKVNNYLNTTSNLILYIIIILWIISIYANIYVYIPAKYDINLASTEDIKNKTMRFNNKKYNRLRFSAGLFVFVLVISIFSIFWMNSLISSQETVQFIISKDNIQILNNSTLYIENGSQKTAPIILLEKRDVYYLVQTTDGNRIEIRKDLIDAIIYINKSSKM